MNYFCLQDRVPFAVVGSNTVVDSGGRKVRGRVYPWGVVEGKSLILFIPPYFNISNIVFRVTNKYIGNVLLRTFQKSPYNDKGAPKALAKRLALYGRIYGILTRPYVVQYLPAATDEGGAARNAASYCHWPMNAYFFSG